MFLTPVRRLLLGAAAGLWGVACGARSDVSLPDAGADLPAACTVDADCAGDACAGAECRQGFCVSLPAKVCPDQDPCHRGSCDPGTGQCVQAPTTPDLDGDGYRSPNPGFALGAPGSCGTDCDDRNAAAHPGGRELCDGVDNDCNGQVDEGAAYSGVTAAVRVSPAGFDRAASGGLAFDGTHYGVTFTGYGSSVNSYFLGIAENGSAVVPETALSDLNSETYAGTLLYNGRYFARAWADARYNGYEVFFNRYDSNGKKLGPDVRVTNAPKFSIRPVMAWNGTEALLAWDDRRYDTPFMEDSRILGQRIAFDGTLIGSNVDLTPAGTMAESPGIALGRQRVGIVYASQVTPVVTRGKFFTTSSDLSGPSAVVDLGGTDVQEANLVYAGGRFIVAWQQRKSNYGPSIYGTVIDESGAVVVSARPITFGATFARSFSLLSLGDRLLLVWADDKDGNYELYQQILDGNLDVLSPRTRLTFTPSDTLNPVAALGPNGDLGVVYDDWVTGRQQSYFLSMSCGMSKQTTLPVK